MGELQAAARALQLLVGGDAFVGLAQVPHDGGVDAARDVEVGVGIVVQLGDRRHAAALGIAHEVLRQQVVGNALVVERLQLERHQQRHLPRFGRVDDLLRWRHVGYALVLEHGELHGALAVDDIGRGQVAQAGLADHQLAKLGRVAGDHRRPHRRGRAPC